MHEPPNVYLSLPGRPEYIVVVRQALTGLASVLGLDAIETNDLNTAVTEACNNVVMHAYAGEPGPMTVEVQIGAEAIVATVRDHGIGMGTARARAAGAPDAGAQAHDAGAPVGMGLAVIEALARRTRFGVPAGGGTEVHMEFALREHKAFEPIAQEPPGAFSPASGAVAVRLAPSSLAAAILPRVLSALAARAYFSAERIADVQALAGVLAANAGDALSAGQLAVGVSIAPRKLTLQIGPLRAGRGERLVVAGADGLAPVIERLTNAQRVAPAASGETLELDLVDGR
ncbi:MAG TPA: ATP-binding protein [Solirubrobacteraceae bacterium]|nr:ATP-binding protein [Solirubrobacteraceae bacterium]